jgi:hypothetical protein
MARVVQQRDRTQGGPAAALLGVLLLGLSGCAGDQPKPPAPTVTPDQVRSHSDKAFENLKQEEQKRAADPAMGP